MRAIAACAVPGLVAMIAAVSVDAGSPATLTVRLYNTSGVATTELLAARRSAETILRDTGLNVIFRQCGRHSPADGTAPCDEPLTSSEVVVRVSSRPRSTPLSVPTPTA